MIHDLCERRGRWPHEFWTLPQAEREEVLAWAIKRREENERTIKAIVDQTEQDGKLSAEVLTARVLMALLRNG